MHPAAAVTAMRIDHLTPFFTSLPLLVDLLCVRPETYCALAAAANLARLLACPVSLSPMRPLAAAACHARLRGGERDLITPGYAPAGAMITR